MNAQAAAPTAEVTAERSRAWVPQVAPETRILVALLIVLVVVAALTTDSFTTLDNGRTIVRAAALVGIAAIGLTFVTLSGNLVSLSVEQTAAATGVLLAILLRDGWPVVVALVVVLALALAVGALQGGVVALGANPIIVTLGVGAALVGITAVISNSEGIPVTGGALDWLGKPRPLGLSIPSFAFVALAILATVFLARRRAGRRIMLVGSNRATAVASGLPVSRTTILAFALSACAAAVVAILTVAQFGRADTGQFNGLTFDALAAVLVGGAAIQGGEGSAARTALGAIFIATLSNLMVLNDWSYGVRLTVQGVVVLLAVSAFHLLQRRRQAR